MEIAYQVSSTVLMLSTKDSRVLSSNKFSKLKVTYKWMLLSTEDSILYNIYTLNTIYWR